MAGFTHADTAIAQATTSVATQSVTLSAAVAVGDVVCLDWGSPAPDSDTISDSAGNTWKFPGAAANVNKSAYSIISVAAAGGITITSTGGGSGTRFMVADRFSVSGGKAVFGAGVTHAVSGTSGNMGTQSSVPGGELLWGALATGTASVTFTAGSSNSVSAVVGSQTGTTSGSGFSEYIVSGAGGTESMTWTASPTISGHGAWQLFFALAAGVQSWATVPVPRRRPARAIAQWRAVPGVYGAVPRQLPQLAVPPRLRPSRGQVQFSRVTTTNAVSVPPPAGTVQPRATVPVPRRTPGRGIWRGTAVPGIFGTAPAQQYRTAPRRAPARAWIKFIPVTTTNAVPAGAGRPAIVVDVESRLIRRYRHMLHRHGLDDWEPEVSMVAAPVAFDVPPGWPGTWPVALTGPEPEPVPLPVLPVLPPPRWRPVYLRPPKVVRVRHVPRDAMMPVWRKG